MQGNFYAALLKEMAKMAEHFKGKRFDTVYFGGGTPSLVSEGDLLNICGALSDHFQFTDDTEVTIEANPGDITPAKARAWKKMGVTRVSLGAQSFQDATLKRINRTHTADDIVSSFQMLKDADLSNINADLILSLPGEGFRELESSLSRAVKLGPTHVSLYELTIEEKTVFGTEFKSGALKLPDEDSQIKMLLYARKYLKDDGFEHYELLNFARKGYQSRHNLLYWANEEYLGLGPGAFSFWGGRRYQYASSVDEYLEKISREDFTAAEEETLTPEKREVESLLLALRRLEGADIHNFTSVFKRLEKEIAGLESQNLLSRTKGRLHLTDRGQLLAETVFTELSSPNI